MKDSAVFTIVSKNYLAHARVFADSFLKNNPGVKVYVVLVDRLKHYFNPKKESFEVIEAEKIGIKNTKSFLFKYNILELNTAVKPFFFEYLFEKYKFKKILYFDPDILVVNKLDYLFRLLDKHSIILTPHITKPINDNLKPNEIDLLKSGSYNLGFIGLAKRRQTKIFLNWWQERIYDKCLYDVENGLFVDQKWINLVPSLFPNYFIIYHPGYNVAYWNLHERKVVLSKKGLKKTRVNKKPLYFFHFSGFDPEKTTLVSIHQDRFSLNTNLKNLRPLFQTYRELLIEKGHRKTKKWPYFYSTFDNGVKINNFVRRLYLSFSDRKKEKFGNPFSTKPNSFFYWLNKPARRTAQNLPYITNLMYELYKSRLDVRTTYPEVFGNDMYKFMEWVKFRAKYEYNLDSKLIKSVEGKTAKRQKTKELARAMMDKVISSPLIQKNKLLFKKAVGSDLYYKIRNLLDVGVVSISKERQLEWKKSSIKRISIDRLGINIAGNISAESGTGEAVRSIIKSVKSAKIPFTAINYEKSLYRKKDKTIKKFSCYNPYKINLVHINADQADAFYHFMGESFFKGKYNIGYWTWEQSTFPHEWHNRFKLFDEIWTPSSFSTNAISKVSPVPVIKIPHCIARKQSSKLSREYFSFPKDKFIFLFVFDFLSVFERKNPIATINAFKRAFPKKDKAFLVLKSVNSKYNPSAMKKMKAKIDPQKMKIIDKYFSSEEVDSLMGICDCYVSLHRSEGFGYTILEAMNMKKPVIATAYSGNTDFMTINNSFPVRYQLVELKKDYGPYKSGSFWAEPDIEHAAKLMRYIYENQDKAKIIGKVASKEINHLYSCGAIGALIKRRLEIIKRNL